MVILTFDSYTSLTLYMHDYDSLPGDDPGAPRVILPEEMGFNTVNPPIKIKMRSGGLLDIVNIDGEFISDVKLNQKQKEYIRNIDETKCIKLKPNYKDGKAKLFKPKLDDYEDEDCWPLTCRMRGYTVTFKHCSDTERRDDYLVRLIATSDRICKKYDRGVAYDYDNDDRSVDDRWPNHDDSEDEDDDMSGSRNYNDSDDNISDTDEFYPKVIVMNLNDGEKVAYSDTLLSTENMFKQVIPISLAADYVLCNIIAIENQHQSCNKCTVKNVKGNTVIEMFNTKVPFEEKTTTVCVLTMILNHAGHCNATDMKKFEKSGYGESGVNFYKNARGTTGVVFTGNQDDENVFNYAMAMDSEMVVPDLLLTESAIANMDSYTLPLTMAEKLYWYRYKYFQKAIHDF